MRQALSRLQPLLHPRISTAGFTLLVSIGLVALYNTRLWSEVVRLGYQPGLHDSLFLVSFALFLVAVLNLLLTSVAFRPLLKPLAILLVMSAAPAAYFSSTFGIVFDYTMVQNLVETDTGEALDLLSPGMLGQVLLLGLLPAILIARTRITYCRGFGALKLHAGVLLLSASVATVAVLSFYQDYASLFRNNRHLSHLIVPTSYLAAAAKYVRKANEAPRVVLTLGEDARRGPRASGHEKPALLVLVLGETARAQNFSLNGYARPTNALLSEQQVISFGNVQACGTSTAVSVPCMFSQLRHNDYDGGKAKGQENLLDVLRHAGLRVLWRENNSGCKGVCDRIEQQPQATFRSAQLCNEEGCFDEVLLNGLEDYLNERRADTVVVLHQNGSHGPAYYRRYPKAFERFSPVCASNQIQNCARQAVLNTYDNTIAYTDYFLARTIEMLKAQSDRFDTAMIYVSDHGESLGEHRLYLHGLPYLIAPEEQKRVPFIVWLSEGYERAFGLDTGCLAAGRGAPLSHDNLFHSMLGLLDVQTGVYDPGLDFSAGCRRQGRFASAGTRPHGS